MKAKIVFKKINREDVKPGDTVAVIEKPLGPTLLFENMTAKQVGALEKCFTYYRATPVIDEETLGQACWEVWQKDINGKHEFYAEVFLESCRKVITKLIEGK